jgi:hypothetical protein
MLASLEYIVTARASRSSFQEPGEIFRHSPTLFFHVSLQFTERDAPRHHGNSVASSSAFRRFVEFLDSWRYRSAVSRLKAGWDSPGRPGCTTRAPVADEHVLHEQIQQQVARGKAISVPMASAGRWYAHAIVLNRIPSATKGARALRKILLSPEILAATDEQRRQAVRDFTRGDGRSQSHSVQRTESAPTDAARSYSGSVDNGRQSA